MGYRFDPEKMVNVVTKDTFFVITGWTKQEWFKKNDMWKRINTKYGISSEYAGLKAYYESYLVEY